MPLAYTVIAVVALTVSIHAEPRRRAIQTDVLDRGTFELYWKGARIGDERFVIREERAGAEGRIVRAGAELNLKYEGRAMRMKAALEAVGADFTPRRYEADFNGPESTTIVGVLLGDRFFLDIRSPRGLEKKQLLVRGRSAILDKHVAHYFAHQYYFTAKLLGSGAAVELSLIVPHLRGQIAVKIEDLGPDSVEVGGRTLELRRVSITPDGQTSHYVWLDGDRVIMVEVPDDEWLAVRSDLTLPSS